MNDENGYATRDGWRTAKSFIRNAVIAVVFGACALASQWVWGLILDPTSLTGKFVTLASQIIFGIVAIAHMVSGAIVLVNDSVRDTIEHVKNWGKRR